MASENFYKKQGRKKLIPHTYIIRGNRKGKVGPGESTWDEYYNAIYRMIKNPVVPRAWVDPMREHLEQVTIMVENWDWATCLA